MPPPEAAIDTKTEPTVWVLTDGKAGDELQCLGVAERLTGAPIIRRVAPRKPFAWLMPRGPIDPREAPGKPGGPLSPPFPDIAIASGRRAVAYLRALKKASNGATFTAFLKDPRTGTSAADLIWVAEHDRLRGDNVLVTATAPHRLTQEKLAAARAAPPPFITALPRPRVAVLVGGDSRHHRFTPADIDRLSAGLETLAKSGASLMGSPSRRTQPPLRQAVAAVFARHGGWWWDGTGENPFLALLAHADAILVTADSTNMLGEATATGRPVLIVEPSGGHAKIAALIGNLTKTGAAHPFRGKIEGEPYLPMDSTPVIADAIRRGWLRHRSAMGLEAGPGAGLAAS